MPITRRPVVDTDNEEVGGEIAIDQKGPLPKDLLEESQMGKVEVADKTFLRNDKAELERFMNEEVEILVQEPMDMLMGEPWVVPLTVGKTTQRVMRGLPQKVKRKYVEVLARARKAGVSATGYKDPTGEAINSFRRHSRALEYPFQVLHDPSGVKGTQWLTGILRSER